MFPARVVSDDLGGVQPTGRFDPAEDVGFLDDAAEWFMGRTRRVPRRTGHRRYLIAEERLAFR
jgi:hypothetical protein